MNEYRVRESKAENIEEMVVYLETVPPEAWDNIVCMANEKNLIDTTIVLPLQHAKIEKPKSYFSSVRRTT